MIKKIQFFCTNEKSFIKSDKQKHLQKFNIQTRDKMKYFSCLNLSFKIIFYYVDKSKNENFFSSNQANSAYCGLIGRW